jgi:hypothetical protein
MKIVDRKTFMALPPETVYSKYAPCFFEGLLIKGETITGFSGEPIDWYYQQIEDSIESSGSDEWAAKLEESELTGKSIAMDFETQGRDGCFEDGQLFAVFEPQDVEALIARLQRCVAVSTSASREEK